MNKTTSFRYIFLTAMILVAAVFRLLPHWPNFTPIAAIALFGGACFSDKRLAYLIPMVIMILSDAAMEFINGTGFHNTLIYVYIGFILTTTIGVMAAKKINVQRIAVSSLLSSILFFVITNFGVWVTDVSAIGLTGLIETYILGIPFFGYTVLGDIFYNAILFGALYYAQIKYPQLVKA